MSNKQDTSTAPAEAKGPTIFASVGSLVDGKRAFAVTYPTKDQLLPGTITCNTSITFSLENWEGESTPGFGQVVELVNVTRYIGGWRAASARPVRVNAEQ